jgi:aspartyl-tRNA(Asn)/glutamyl-tRNA(Gln) amidotransferase subunit C
VRPGFHRQRGFFGVFSAGLRRRKGLCYSLTAGSGPGFRQEGGMAVDSENVRRIAHLARIAVTPDEVEHLKGEINAILAFVEQLQEVDVTGVAPMTSVTPMVMPERPDIVTDGDIADDILRNAPARQDHYFMVPKVVE